MEPSFSKTIKYIKYTLVVLGVILIVFIVALFLQYRYLSRTEIMNLRQQGLNLIHRRQPLTINDVNYIQTWMTFDYLNRVFNIPSDYLKTKLAISDTRYPRLSLRSYTSNYHLNINVFLTDTKNAISNYLTTKK